MTVLMGLDIGTSGARAVAVGEDGGILAEAVSAYGLDTPHPGWAEQRPQEWWTAAKAVLRRVAGTVGGERIAGLGITGQMHGAVFLDAQDAVIRPALLWNDQRTAEQCDAITSRVGADRLLATTGNAALTGFQAPKILWLADAEPHAYRRVRSVLLPKDYIRLQLTGDRATDASDASGTLLLDIGRRAWSPEILDALEIPESWLPLVFEGTEATGRLLNRVADDLGLPRGLTVAAGAGDNAAAAVGAGIIQHGLVSSSVGTSGVVFAHRDTGLPDQSGRIQTFCHAFPGAYHQMGVTLSAGGSLAWWRQIIGAEHDFDALAREAADVRVGSDGLVFLPYLTGERTPHLDPRARGGFVGLTLRHGRAHMTRAVMEGVIFSMRQALEIMRTLGLKVEEVRAVGGGARSVLWRQLQADVFGHPVRRTAIDEGPALGAALLAGVACGLFPVSEATSQIELDPAVNEPDPARMDAYDEVYGVYGSLYEINRQAMHDLAELDAR